MYIANFEETKFSLDNNLDNKSLNRIKILLINILPPIFIVFNNKISKAFFNLLGLIEKAEKIAINFANRLFNHSFITISNVLLARKNCIAQRVVLEGQKIGFSQKIVKIA